MRRLKLMVLAVGAAMVMSVGLAGPAAAGGKVGSDPGRGNSTAGLANAQIRLTDLLISGHPVPTEQVTLNIARSQNPDQPGAIPGGGGGVQP